MNLIEEADEKLILVSPYCDFSNWDKFTDAFKFVKQKNIDVEFYVREGKKNQGSFDDVISLGYEPIAIKNLHVKLYMNEKSAISGSMNLTQYSDKHSLDLAFITENKTEYLELKDFYERYLFPKKNNNNKLQFKNNDEWLKFLQSEIMNSTNKNFYLNLEFNNLIIKGSNIYNIHISNNYNSNFLNICGILSASEKATLSKQKTDFERKLGFHVNLYKPGFDDYGYNTIWHHSNHKLNSNTITGFLTENDYNIITPIILNFIIAVELFKDEHYISKKSSF